MRADPLCRAAHDRSDEAHDPRQSRSDTSPPISQATARPPIGRCREATRPIFLRETETGTKLSLLNAPTPKPGQNSPCSTHPHPNRDKTLPAQAKRPEFHVFGRAGGILSRKCPNVRALGEFCHGHAPKSARLANFVTDMPRSPRAWRILSRTCPEVPRPGTFCPAISCTLARSPTGSYVHRLLHRWAGTTHGASEAWLRCPWAVAGPGRASRSITPSRRLACGDLAGGPPPTGTHSSPATARAHKAARRLHGHTQQPGRGHGQPTGTHSSPAAARAHNEAATGFPATASSMNERQR